MNGSDADDTTSESDWTGSDSRSDHESPEPPAGGAIDQPLDAIIDAAAATSSVAQASLNGRERGSRPNRVSSVLVAVGPGPHSGATVDVARRIASETDAWLELFHVAPSPAALADADAEDGSADPAAEASAVDGDELLTAARERLGDFDRVDRWLVEDESAAGAIVEQSPYYDLVVVGASTTGTVGRFVFGSTTDTVVDEAAVPVVVVASDTPAPLRE